MYPPVVEYTVYDVAGGDSAGREKDTVTDPLLNGLLVPTSVATTLMGGEGCKKSFCCADLFPDSFFATFLPGISNQYIILGFKIAIYDPRIRGSL
jgi:hypothetical protein